MNSGLKISPIGVKPRGDFVEKIKYSCDADLIGSYDIAVIGGGPAGVCAAIEAARNGAKTVLIEGSGMLGGMATTALVGPFMTSYDRDGQHRIVKGLFEEIVSRTEKINGAIDPAKCDAPSIYTSFISEYHKHTTPFDSFALQLTLDDMIKESGVDLLLYTRYIDSILKDEKIEAVILDALQGVVSVRAKQFIDCTGIAALAHKSGVKTVKGDEKGNSAQPATLFFEVAGVDDNAYSKRPKIPVKAYKMPQKGRYKVNHYRVFDVDATNSISMTNAHIQARKQVLEAYKTLKNEKGFENSQIIQVAPVLGSRESRHIDGYYCLTVKDICDGAVFDDSICVFGYGMDVHPRKLDMPGGFHGKSANMYEIPYRCMIPHGCDNLLIAGKTVCAESQAAGSLRVMPACMAMGQAAGAAAAIAVKNGKKPADISTEELRFLLRSHGAVIDIDEFAH